MLVHCSSCQSPVSGARPDVAQPDTMNIQETSKRMRLTVPVVRGACRVLIAAVGVAAVVGALLCGAASVALLWESPHSFFPPLFVLAAGVFWSTVAYSSAGLVLGRAVLEVTPEALTTRCEPLPMGRAQRHETGAIAQLFVQEFRAGQAGVPVFEVRVLRTDGMVETLLRLPDAREALHAEQRIEAFLGIEDRHVSGELPRL